MAIGWFRYATSRVQGHCESPCCQDPFSFMSCDRPHGSERSFIIRTLIGLFLLYLLIMPGNRAYWRAAAVERVGILAPGDWRGWAAICLATWSGFRRW